MATELLDRRSRPPSRLYRSAPGPIRPQLSSAPHPPGSASSGFRPPSSLRVYSSTMQNVEISEVQFTSQQSAKDNHSERLKLSGMDALLRRGNTLVLKITLTTEIACPYCVSLTFVPVFRPRDRFGQFQAKGAAKGSSELWLSITIPANFPIGKYHAHIAVSLKGGAQVATYFHHKPLIILFNPWNPGGAASHDLDHTDDDSYIEDDSHRRDYLINDVGVIWRGTSRHKVPLTWEFGQYEENCLDVALFLLRTLTANECRQASAVARAITAGVNSRDNTGIMAASYTGGTHMGGIHPCRWNGSSAILQKFYRTKTPVRYGQCWVFAGVCVTLLRALGIACRPVTCYNSAHFCSKLGQVDRYFSTEGELVDELSRDQIWIYHVWCEAWMRRDDLPPGYDGWQVLDATSQDKQCGRFRVGPAPVMAIHERKSGKEWLYGGEFVISEVTADVRYLRVGKNFTNGTNKHLSVAHVSHDEVGVALVTSRGDQESPLDLTGDYKDPPEKPATTGILSGSRFPPPSKDCSFEVKTSDNSALGEEIKITVTIANRGAMMRTVDGRVLGTVIHYTGQPVKNFMSMQFTGVISPGQSASVSLPIEPKKYMKILVEQAMLQFFVAVKVRESKQLFLKVHPFQLHQPQVDIECPAKVQLGTAFRVKLKFRNVLGCSLSRVLFLVQAGALCPQRELSHKRLVLPGGIIGVEFSLRGMQPGVYTLLASLFCDQITDIRGSAKIEIVQSLTPPDP